MDDQEVNLDLIERQLARKKYQTDVATSGRQALEMIDNRSYDLLLLDIMMPDMDGLKVLRQIRSEYDPSKLPVIMVTAKAKSSDIVECLSQGANDYITKPIDFPVFHARVDTQINLKQAEDEIYKLNKSLEQQVELKTLDVFNSQKELAEAQRMVKLGSWTMEHQDEILRWSDEVFRIIEKDPKQFHNPFTSFIYLVHPEDRDMVNQAFSESIKNKVPYNITHRLLMDDGRVKYVQEKCKTIYADDGTALRSVGTILDVTERTEIEKERQRLLKENEKLLNRSMVIQEEERKNIARELHDELGQSLAGIRMDVDFIRGTIHDPQSEEMLAIEDIQVILDETTMRIRQMSERLRPMMLDYMGLEQALREIIEKWASRNRHIKTTFKLNGTGSIDELPEIVSLMFYRVVQESLTNITRHANADHVDIQIEKLAKHIIMSIQDDGLGMDLSQPSSGLGLAGMRERVRASNGKLDVISKPGQGVEIQVHVNTNNFEGNK